MTQDAKSKGGRLKLIIRRLPREFTEEDLKEQIDQTYETIWFCPADKDLMPWSYSRAYIVFDNMEKAQEFRNKFHGYVFVDKKGIENQAVVEMAFHQEVPKSFPKDALISDKRTGTLETRPDYQEFLSAYEATTVVKKVTDFDELIKEVESKEKMLEDGQVQSTPLTDFMSKQYVEKEKKRKARRDRHAPFAAIEEEKKTDFGKKPAYKQGGRSETTREQRREEKKEIKKERLQKLQDKYTKPEKSDSKLDFKKEPREPREPREPKEAKDPAVQKEKEPKETREPKEQRERLKKEEKPEKEKRPRRRDREERKEKEEKKEEKKTIKLLTKDKNNEDVFTEIQKSSSEKERLPSALVPDPSMVNERTAKGGEGKEKRERTRKQQRPEREVYRPTRARQPKELKEKPAG
ncbi:unnamed protein product [Bursaphelenchus okinawaensis]|uniref:UPF3 domain-containing protein n=1 Tax=Bursaphelenchus okinawaensis TaxID=465554 RepID=A0A811LKY8_9BILA|nr:unnamed protein product [Bursaphelenchus okinawaensis]CAG9127674.1 unnamed protein product [Bursaphelenchus okinawaensis]